MNSFLLITFILLPNNFQRLVALYIVLYFSIEMEQRSFLNNGNWNVIIALRMRLNYHFYVKSK